MGVVKGFWEVLKPVARFESPEFLRGKVLAIDLSFWLIQTLSAVKGVSQLRQPHIRLLFFRTIHLVSKLGAFPVFITDGAPPPLKLGVRLDRYSRMTGVLVNKNVGFNVARNGFFTKYIDECVEMLGLLGMPVLQAKHEAEGLCADLNKRGLVDACVTPDSDAFLYGADCVIKTLQADPKNLIIETYRMQDIVSNLGLHREHLVALALLVGCDFNVNGVPGVGCHNGVRLIKTLASDDVLERLSEWGVRRYDFQTGANVCSSGILSDEIDCDGIGSKFSLSGKMKAAHCSSCGHPGTKKLHSKLSCQKCKFDNSEMYTGSGCTPKSGGFRCFCEACMKEEAWKKKTKEEGWKLKVCEKLYKTEGFPNTEIINIFMNSTHQDSSGDPNALMPRPVKSEALEEFLMDQLFWDRFYVRQKILPLLSFYCLMDLAGDNIVSNACLVKPEGLICGAYAPHSIQCVKISNSKALYRLRWRAIGPDCHQIDWLGMRFSSFTQQRNVEDEKLGDVAEVATSIERESIENDLLFTTDENIELVEKACPDLVHQFRQEQAIDLLPNP